MADNKGKKGVVSRITAELFAHKVILWWLPLLYFLISSLFYLRTYDSAQVKITMMQMGGLALLTLWVVRLVELGISSISKDDLVCLSPFLAYLAVGILSFLHAPYHMASVDFFLRHFFFMTAALIMIYEFNQQGTERLTRVLIWTGWVAIGYGFLQWVDHTWFPPGVGRGIDPFIWRGAFGDRVFSTYGNPNFFADFLVILFPILVTQFMKERRWSLIPLTIMLLITLVRTGTKGAWVGFAIVLIIFGILAFVYFDEIFGPYKKRVLGVVLGGALLFGGLVAKDVAARIVSVNFRLFTWEGTWEMIMTQPLIGTGVGSFPPIYPAFRRPPIFHIEGKHNTETDHSENEYIEQLFDNGILGFGVFLWLIFSTLVVGFRSLGQLTGVLRGKDGKPHPRAWDLIGYMVAFMGMLGHNMFDVSMRFVSSGVYLGLLSGTIVNLARGKGLYELHELREDAAAAAGSAPPPADGGPSLVKVVSEFLIWPARGAAVAGMAYVSFLIFKEFAQLQGPVGRLTIGGEVLQWYISWGTLSACVLGLGAAFVRLVLLAQNPAGPFLVLAACFPMYQFWGYFKSDIHHNIAIYFSKERNWDQALHHYFEVHRLNPDFVMAHYFEGNVYNDRFNMQKVSNPAWGDKPGVARDDYERALDAYNEVRRRAPNYVQMHHQVGALHMKRAEWAMNNKHPEEMQKYLDRAMNRFRLYENIDPVFAPNYYRMGQVFMIQKKYEEAAKVYEDLINAEKCSVAPSLISTNWLRRTILSYHSYVDDPAVPYPVHKHESAEAYTNLANAYFLLERMKDSETAYLKALAMDPNFDQAKKNLGVLYSKAQAKGQLRKVPPPTAAPKPGQAPYTGFEVVTPLAPKK
jgi:O-antigen ligase/tetratricopeptide (TPR) repeat protein